MHNQSNNKKTYHNDEAKSVNMRVSRPYDAAFSLSVFLEFGSRGNRRPNIGIHAHMDAARCRGVSVVVSSRASLSDEGIGRDG